MILININTVYSSYTLKYFSTLTILVITFNNKNNQASKLRKKNCVSFKKSFIKRSTRLFGNLYYIVCRSFSPQILIL